MSIDLGDGLALDESAVTLTFVRSRGAGGQNVNKLATAVDLKFDIAASNLDDEAKRRLLERPDRRVGSDGVFRLKAQRFRTQERNRRDALERLAEWLKRGLETRAERRPTQVPRAERRRRLDAKSRRGEVKRRRTRPTTDDS